jgi:hypothetical protein
MIVNNELKRIRKKAVMAKFKILSQHLPEGTEEYHKTSARIVCVPGTSQIQIRRVSA